MNKKIVIVTSGQPALNPRMVKEADTLCSAGYDVTVLYSYWNEWGTALDENLIPTKKWKAIRVGGSPQQQKLTYFISRLISKVAQIICRKTKGRFMADWALARASYFLTRSAKKQKADLYIGHNLGALPATVKAAKTNYALCGFDAEDFHRNEVSNDINNPDVILKTALENSYIPQIQYLSASSPLITKAYKDLFPKANPITLLNCFPNDWDIEPVKSGPTIRLLWFSQTISINRGLEDIIKAFATLTAYPFELHLLGSYTEGSLGFIDALIDRNKIHFHNPVSPEQLTTFSSQFDIGLALEPGFSINNNLALSNKIFTYLQSGLAIVASDTPAQQQLIERYTAIGKIYPKGDFKALADILLYYHQHRDILLEMRKAALTTARTTLNWEKESEKFLDLVKKTLLAH